MANHEPTVFVVDDDAAMCESLACLLESQGLRARTFESAEAFLASYRPDQPGCLVLDIRMRGMSGLELQARLAQEEPAVPIIVITGHGDIPMAVRAMKAGAVDFLEKPVNDQVLLQRIRQALERDRLVRQQYQDRHATLTCFARLTPRERDVMKLVVDGKANKQIAAELGVAEKTVEVHRKRIMQKMNVRSAVALVRAVVGAHLPL